MTPFQNVCKVSDVPEGEARMFVIDGKMIGVFHVAGQFFALDDRCPHAGASLAHGIVEDEVVRCRIHHWRFCIRDGAYLDEQKPEFDVPSYSVRVVGEQVQIKV